MKKLVFVLAAILFSVVSLVAEPNTSTPNNVTVEIISEKEGDFKECSIRIKGTYDGKQIDVVVTVEADNCAVAAGELLKAYAK